MSHRRPDLRLLANLEALLETRSVSRAADRMGVSQPAMSRILARLRDQLGDPLLVRGGGGMVLTPYAEALAEPLRRWLTTGERLLLPQDFDPVRLDRAFRIASTDFGILSVIRGALAGMAKAAPSVSFDIEALSSASLKRLAGGWLDLVIIGYRPEHAGVQWKRLFTEHRLCIARRDHPLLTQPVTTERFFDWPHVAALVGDGYVEPLAGEGVDTASRRMLLSAPSFSSIPYLVAETDALSVLPSRAARYFADVYGLAVFEPPIPMPDFDYYVAWHERSTNDDATQWLVRQLSAAQAANDAEALRRSA